jgi:hypothetical protein
MRVDSFVFMANFLPSAAKSSNQIFGFLRYFTMRRTEGSSLTNINDGLKLHALSVLYFANKTIIPAHAHQSADSSASMP